MFGELLFDRIEPGGIGLAIFAEQAVTFAQGRFVTVGVARMLGIERKRQPVHIASSILRRPGEEAIHRRGEPADRDPFAERDGAGLGAVDAHAAAARLRGFGISADPNGFVTDIIVSQARADRETAGPVLARHIGQRRPPHAPARREERERLEDIGLARSISADEQVQPTGPIDRGFGMVAEVRKRDAVERHERVRR